MDIPVHFYPFGNTIQDINSWIQSCHLHAFLKWLEFWLQIYAKLTGVMATCVAREHELVESYGLRCEINPGFSTWCVSTEDGASRDFWQILKFFFSFYIQRFRPRHLPWLMFVKLCQRVPFKAWAIPGMHFISSPMWKCLQERGWVHVFDMY